MTKPYKSILMDAMADNQLLNLGYAVFPLLSKETTKQLLDHYMLHHPDMGEGMHASAHSQDIVHRKLMSDTIREAVVPALANIVHNAMVLGGSFISKSPNTRDKLKPHQDWNITDESQFRSFNLWIPLIDTNADNGAIMVLPKSHLFPANFRGPSIPSICEATEDILWLSMETLEIPAGHALLYDHRLIHASGPNMTNQSRVVAVVGLLEIDAPMCIYYGEEGEVAEYVCTSDFFLEQNPNDGPKDLLLSKRFAWDVLSIEREVVIRGLKEAGCRLLIQASSERKGSRPKGFFAKWMKSIFG